MLVKLESFPQGSGMKIKNILKPPPRKDWKKQRPSTPIHKLRVTPKLEILQTNHPLKTHHLIVATSLLALLAFGGWFLGKLGASLPLKVRVFLLKATPENRKAGTPKNGGSLQGGPLPVITGFITPINGLVLITLVIGVINPVITGRGPTLYSLPSLLMSFG